MESLINLAKSNVVNFLLFYFFFNLIKVMDFKVLILKNFRLVERINIDLKLFYSLLLKLYLD